MTNGQYGYARLEPTKKATTEDLKQFYKLYNEYIDRYGLGDSFNDYLEEKKHFINLNLDFAISGDRMLLTYIEISRKRLEELKPNEGEGVTIGQHLVILNKWLGQWINKKSITVVEYKDLIKEYERANKT